MWLPWNIAAIAGLVLGAIVPVLPKADRGWRLGLRALVRELALMFGLYALWQRAAELSVMKLDGALGRGRAIWHFERAVGMGIERWLNVHAFAHSWLIQACNAYYAIVHVPALGVFLVWMWFRHRDRYGRWRNTLALTTGVCLAIQYIPVAPPRLLHDLGFIDTANKLHQSVYGQFGAGASDQLSAMPSVHVAWAVLIATAVFTTSRSKWRWLAVAHAVITVLVISATANHWLLDGVVAVGIMVAMMGLQQLGRRAWRAWRAADDRAPAPVVVDDALARLGAGPEAEAT
jgi:hypothetical protein